MTRVAITGAGNVGQRIIGMLHQRQDHYRRRFGTGVRVTGICGSQAGLIDPAGITAERAQQRADFTPGLTGAAFMEQLEADVLIDAGPSDYDSGGPALGYFRAGLDAGMHLIAVSKGALVTHAPELLKRAAEEGVELKMSGAAASALPTIDFLTHNLAGAQVQKIEAILTGTTTFVLDAMTTQGLSLQEALGQARERGIAEPDPSFDIDGWDTAAKVVVIVNAVFGQHMDLHSLPKTSLSEVTETARAQWADQGLTPRLVGYIEQREGKLAAGVELRTYPSSHAFSLTQGSTKALYAATDVLGEFTLLGGASNPDATAAAALKDLEQILTAHPSNV
ncbi:homoserine dehydrogenase [Nesterenkonia sp. MY13]|uniref:Homoserine dehydrogenase n=1 Tax=Nesterenkonia sedimenti TaxID=1463632 RepID=A0A7X8TJC0_9MICC|nr:homoserine dehydrogenase [Nesterenkonia sedimenti]NLS09634.1 homoserine dehydrogenase [Nesterenkonia sedimenti]